jgi:hypothetical protein
VKSSSSIAVLLLLTAALATAQTKTSQETDTGIPKFYAQSRQILIAATVSDTTKTDTSWIPKDVLKQHSSLKSYFTIHPPVTGLNAQSFQVFDNGIPQPINYFKEVDFPGANLTNKWYLHSEIHGTWGFFEQATVGLDPPSATYLIGYAPPALQPGECRKIRIVAGKFDVHLNREQYCTTGPASIEDSLGSPKLAMQMREVARSRKTGSISVSMHAFTFWSSGVLSLIKQQPAQPANVSTEPTAEYKYSVEVHDSKAPASVHVNVGLPGLGLGTWAYDCPKNPVIQLLGVVYRSNGEVAREFADTFPCRKATQGDNPGLSAAGLETIRISIPDRYETQVELSPGEYELHVVIRDGKDMGQAYIPVQVQPLNVHALTLSDVVIAGIVRYSGWVLLDAASLAPAPVLPRPLVSKSSQYMPDSDADLNVRKRTGLDLYFEIYKAQNAGSGEGVYYQWRITNLKNASEVMSSERLSATEWMIPGNGVIPIGLTLNTENLKKGSYQVEVQASDSTGHQSEWRKAEFKIK